METNLRNENNTFSRVIIDSLQRNFKDQCITGVVLVVAVTALILAQDGFAVEVRNGSQAQVANVSPPLIDPPDALVDSGIAHMQHGDYAAAYRLFLAAAEQDSAEAQNDLGMLYLHGLGVDKDYSIATRWFSKASEKGDVVATYNLGCIYLDGLGLAKDEQRGAQLILQAARGGLQIAQNQIGILYMQSRGVAADHQEAANWFRTAADGGDVAAQFNLGMLYVDGNGVAQSYAEAAKWLQKAADQGSRMAQHNLGYMYAAGKGVPQNDRLATMWYKRAAETEVTQTDPVAQVLWLARKRASERTNSLSNSDCNGSPSGINKKQPSVSIDC
ncbi:tetratricopeptide repeat protein [Burkholderia cenocepacia]|uniref:tetratricopeptide repeat protein n=1 Tax=Burkholderia cenocepacia TaxID=95486 RepID=UPI00406D38D5